MLMPKEHIWEWESVEKSGVVAISQEDMNMIAKKVDFETKKIEKIKDKKSQVEELLWKYPALKAWVDKISANWSLTIGKNSIYENFVFDKVVSMEENEIKDLKDTDLSSMFESWNAERLANLRKNLTLDNLQKFSLHHQKSLLWNWNKSKNEKFLKEFKNETKDEDSYENAVDFFYNYSLEEIVWEVLMQEDFKKDKNGVSVGFEKMQWIASLYVNENHSFEILHDWRWWKQTRSFFRMLLNNKQFMNSPNWALYREKIRLLFRQNRAWAEDMSLYDSMSNVQKRMDEYVTNPIKYWKEQSVLSRHFVWVEESKTPYPSVDKMSDSDKDFISWNRSESLDSDLSELFDMRWKTPEQRREIMERLMSLMPKEELRQHLTEFLKKENIRKEFSELFKKPASVLDDPLLVETIINDRWWQEKFSDIRKWITSWMWASIWTGITSLSIDIQSYIRKQCGLSALSVRGKFLESVFWEGTSFETVDREIKVDPSSAEYPIYFRDKNNPSTVYEYRPNTWDILAEKYYSSVGWNLSFWKWKQVEAPMSIHTMKAKFSDFMQNIPVADLLPKDRVESRSDLKDVIWKNIEAHMNYSVPAEEGETMKKTNKLMNLKNGTIDSALKLFGLLDSNNGSWISLSKEEDGPYYRVMKKLVDNVENASEWELNLLNTFMEDLADKVQNAEHLEIKSITNPIVRFVVAEYKGLKAYWEDKVKAWSKEEEWKKKDVLLWIVMESVFDWDKLNFDKLRILNDWVKDYKFRELALSIETKYNWVAEQNEIAVAGQMFGSELHALSQDITVWEEFGSRLEEAYA